MVTKKTTRKKSLNKRVLKKPLTRKKTAKKKTVTKKTPNRQRASITNAKLDAKLNALQLQITALNSELQTTNMQIAELVNKVTHAKKNKKSKKNKNKK